MIRAMRKFLFLLALFLIGCDDEFFDVLPPDAGSTDGPVADAPDIDGSDAAEDHVDASEDHAGDASDAELVDGGADAGDGQDAGLGKPLACAWKNALPKEIANQESETGGKRVFSKLYIAHLDNSTSVRVITDYDDSLDEFVVHTFASDGSNYEAASVGETESTISLARVSSSSLGLLTTRSTFDSDGGFDRRLVLEEIPDLGFPSEPSVVHTVVDWGTFGSTTTPEAQIVGGTIDGDLFIAADYFAEGEYRTGFIKYAGTPVLPTVVHTANSHEGSRLAGASHIGSQIRLYVGSPFANQVSFPDDSPASAILRAIGGADSYLIAVGADDSQTRFAVGELASARLRIGSIDSLDLDTFVLEDLSYVAGNVDFAIFSSGPVFRWGAEQFVTLGFSSAAGNGISGLWLDVRGNIRFQGELVDATPGRRIERIAFSSRPPALWEAGGVLDVTWIERVEQADGGASYDVLLYNQLICALE